jgi:hypothetical protein
MRKLPFYLSPSEAALIERLQKDVDAATKLLVESSFQIEQVKSRAFERYTVSQKPIQVARQPQQTKRSLSSA